MSKFKINKKRLSVVVIVVLFLVSLGVYHSAEALYKPCPTGEVRCGDVCQTPDDREGDTCTVATGFWGTYDQCGACADRYCPSPNVVCGGVCQEPADDYGADCTVGGYSGLINQCGVCISGEECASGYVPCGDECQLPDSRDGTECGINGEYNQCGICVGERSLWQEGDEAGEIYYDEGNVGIGTDDPSHTLDLVSVGNAEIALYSGGSSVLEHWGMYYDTTDGARSLKFYWGNDGDLDGDKFIFENTGDFKLKGKIGVWNGADDYVFGSAGQVLTSTATGMEWAEVSGGTGSVESLGDIGDVNTDPCANGQVIKYDGTSWTCADDIEGAGGGGGIEITCGDNETIVYDEIAGDWECREFTSNFWELNNPTDPDNSGLQAIPGGSIASGQNSVAFGYRSIASGWRSVAFGNEASVTNSNAVAIGGGVRASGINAVSIGTGSSAEGDQSVAIGVCTSATGSNAISLGNGCVASGSNSLALGLSSISSGLTSASFGSGTQSNGTNSVSFGQNTVAEGNNSVVMGNYNIGIEDSGYLGLEGSFLEIGNGDSDGSRSNIFTLLKNGSTRIGNLTSGSTLPSHSLELYRNSDSTYNSEIYLSSNGGVDAWGIYHDDPDDPRPSADNSNELRFWNGDDLFIFTDSGDMKMGQTDADVDLVVGTDDVDSASRICLNGECIDSWGDAPDIPYCGNGVLERGEQCDGDIIPTSCQGLGYSGGLLSCDNCRFDTSGCSASGVFKNVFVTGGTPSGHGVSSSSMTDGTTQGRIEVTLTDGTILVGRDAADRICMNLAQNSTALSEEHKPSSGAVYKAWLSGEDENGVYMPVEDFYYSTMPYYLVDGVTKIADNWDDLVDRDFENFIDKTENNIEITSPEGVWSNTHYNGTDCLDIRSSCGEDWSLIAEQTFGGITYHTDDRIILGYCNATVSIKNCDEYLHLYCFEQ